MARTWGQRLLPLVGLLSLGCAAGQHTVRPDGVPRLLQRARDAGLELEVPFDIDPGATSIFTSRAVAHGPATDRFHQVRRYVLGQAQGQLTFAYSPRETYTANQALHWKRGDCVSFSNLVVALARGIHVPAFFVQVRSAPVYYAYGEQVLATTHIAAGFGAFPHMQVADLLDRSGLYTHGYFEKLEDADALALHYSNKAVELLQQGDAAGAERLLAVLIAERPQVEELHVNLGSVLLHQERAAEALALLDAALVRFPTSASILNNALQAARALGRRERVAELEALGMRVAAKNPLFHFHLGVARQTAGDTAGAVRAYEEALRLRPELALFTERLVEAQLAAGQGDAARAAFARLRAERPRHLSVKRLLARYPELQRDRATP
ncbi:MAG: tetratricopeptide repeat protein [Myxococcaceae bacterium]|nr:tetratricopeptide repeat protein [Myxococcaceae bacterium]